MKVKKLKILIILKPHIQNYLKFQLQITYSLVFIIYLYLIKGNKEEIYCI